ncbi:MAG: hypothetical protein ACKOEM_05515 [Planctomycetia bacterium]
MRSQWLLCLLVAASLAGGVARGEAAITIVDDLPGAGRLAAPATGQTLYVLDDTARTVTAVDPFAPAKRWRAIGPADLDAGSTEPVRPAAIACIDSNTLAIVCRVGGEWTLRAFRLAPPGVDGGAPSLLQSLPLGNAANASSSADVFVSDTRDWLAVVGLPAPLPPVVRAPIAGARLGNFSDRLCPPIESSDGLEAATSSPFDEWVVIFRRDAPPPGRTALSFHANTARPRLLDLDPALAGVRDAAFCRGNGTLWVVAEGDGKTAAEAGLWRIDAALATGRQVAVPVAVARLPAPLSVVCLSERAVAISGGGADRRVLLVNPAQPQP